MPVEFSLALIIISFLALIVDCTDISRKFESHQLPMPPYQAFTEYDEHCRNKHCQGIKANETETCGRSGARHVINCIILEVQSAESTRFEESVAKHVRDCQKNSDDEDSYLFGTEPLVAPYKEVFKHSVFCGWRTALEEETVSEDLIVDALTKAQEFCEAFNKAVTDSTSEVNINLCIWYDVWETMLEGNRPVPAVIKEFNFDENFDAEHEKQAETLRHKLTPLAVISMEHDKAKAVNKTLNNLEECLRENKFLQPQMGDYEEINRKSAKGRKNQDFKKYNGNTAITSSGSSGAQSGGTPPNQQPGPEGNPTDGGDKTGEQGGNPSGKTENEGTAVKRGLKRETLSRRRRMEYEDYEEESEGSDNDDNGNDYSDNSERTSETSDEDVEYDVENYDLNNYADRKAEVLRCAYNKYRKDEIPNKNRGGKKEFADYSGESSESESDSDYESGGQRTAVEKSFCQHLKINSVVLLAILAAPALIKAF